MANNPDCRTDHKSFLRLRRRPTRCWWEQRPHLGKLCAFALLAPIGCASENTSTSGPRGGESTTELSRQEEGRALFGGRAPANSGDPALPRNLPGWVLALAPLEPGTDAQALRSQARAIRGLTDIRVERWRGQDLLVGGSFRERGDEELLELRAAARALQVNNTRPFAGAFPLPISVEPVQGSLAPLDLRNAVAGDPSIAYTLQVATFGVRADQPVTDDSLRRSYRRAAEYAQELRAGGEEAYFLHGNSGSVVVIGTFAESDVDRSTSFLPRHSPEVTELLERFGSQLINGRQETRTVRLRDGRLEQRPVSSVIIEAPR
ncbi:MAG: hypothetical protein AAFR38_05420 [Planctomycetota bacterium]